MNRRLFLKTTLKYTSALSGLSLINNCSRPGRKPNIILIMADDLGYGDLGCFGNTYIKTPFIDALASAGLTFTDFHSNCPVCSPTRAALLTGRYQQRAGIEGVVTALNHRDVGLEIKEVTFAELLQKEGYETALFGKWHVGYDKKYNPVHQGFDEFKGYVSGNVDYVSHIDQVGIEDWWNQDKLTPETGYVTELISDYGVDFIKRHKHQSFCLYLAHESPHYPYQGPDDPPDRTVGDPQPVRGSRTDQKGAYNEMIESMDKGVGKIVKTVKELGLEKDTFLFFCSDNGPIGPGSAGPLRGHKGTLWEGGTRVPAIACWPGKITPQSKTDEIVLSMDLFPTILSLAGGKIPAELKLDGVNFSDMLFNRARLPERTLFWRFRQKKAVRKGNWKYYFDGKETWLFDLSIDLGEQNNLASQKPDILKELETDFKQWEEEVTAGVHFNVL